MTDAYIFDAARTPRGKGRADGSLHEVTSLAISARLLNAMAERSGLDVKLAGDVLAAGSPGSPLVKMLVPRMVARDYTPNFLVPLMVKDLTYVIETFGKAGIDLADARAARERFQAAAGAGHQDQDIASVVELLRRR